MDPKTLCRSATELSARGLLKRLALLSVGVIVAANLLSVLIETLITSLLSDATGLAMLGKRTALMTLQSMVQLAVSAALPFWSYGFYRAAMETARNTAPTYKSLLSGFHRFGPLLRLLILEVLIAMGYIMLGSMVSSMAYMMTPWAAQTVNEITPALMEAEALQSDPAALNALMEPIMKKLLLNMWPMYLLMVVVAGALLIPWLYKLRLAPYHILDGESSALKAMAFSQQEMYGNKLSFFKLDLQWWWYYGLLFLASLPLYIYTYTGGSEGLFWAFTLLSLGLQLVVQWQFLPRVQSSYALAYDQLKLKTE